MRASLLSSGLLAASLARAASSTLLVDASKFTTVTVDAPLYDTKLSDDNGCDPSGCQGSLTRVSYLLMKSFASVVVQPGVLHAEIIWLVIKAGVHAVYCTRIVDYTRLCGVSWYVPDLYQNSIRLD